MEQSTPSRVSLGGFELNLQTGELRPLGHADGNGRVVLREQSFQILKMLIERGGKIVTREEIRRKLWPNDTIVNFDHSINVAIRMLRRALGDSAESPQYIETFARRGYRLLVATEILQTHAEPPRREGALTETPSGSGGIIGKKVSHYRVLDIIGGGGMGMVYRAEDLKLGRRVALKFLPEEVADDALALRRFEREARTASALNHPNICTIHEIEEHEGQPFIVMELLEGASLNHCLDSFPEESIPIPRLLEIALQICDGLQAAHEKGIIHRDIKPANIFLTQEGPVKILDFGLAKLAEHEEAIEPEPALVSDGRASSVSELNAQPKPIQASMTLTGSTMGTAAYMSPEQVRREQLDVTTDLFSFGLVLYEAIAGHRAFAGETTTAIQNAILCDNPAPIYEFNPAAPRKLCAVIAKALEKDRIHRYQSAAEMRQALERAGKETRSEQRRKRTWLAACALLSILFMGAWIYWRLHHRAPLSPGDTVVLAVSNETNDLVFDDAIYTGVFWDLRQTPYIHVLDQVELHAALSALHIPDDAKKTPQIARQVCLHTNSRMVIATSVSEEGNGFRIEMRGEDCQSGKTIVRVRNDATSRAQVIHVLGLSATQLRNKLGEPGASIARFSKPLDEAMSPSPEAIQLLTEGYRRTLAMDTRSAVSYFQRAIALDSNFAMAFSALAALTNNLGEHAAAVAVETKAYALRDRVTVPVRFEIEDEYYDMVTGEQEKAYSVLSQWVQMFPDDFVAHNNFVKCLILLGRHDQALAEAREAARLFPSPWSYRNLIYRDILTNRFKEARATFEDAAARKFDMTDLHSERALLAFLQRDEAAMQQQWNWALGKRVADEWLLSDKGRVEAYYGRYQNYLRISGQAIDMARKYGELSDAATYNNAMALQEAEVGNMTRARQLADRSLSMAQNEYTEVNLALVLARAGDIAQAQKLVDKIEREYPLDTVIQNYSLPAIRAAMKLQTDDPAGAIDILRTTVKYDLAFPPSFNSLYPAYIRGQAYLQMGNGRLASAEFQKLLDHPGIVGRDVTGALSYLQMARAERIAGDRAAARKSYQAFLTLWKDADSDIPIYRQAKVEYAALRP